MNAGLARGIITWDEGQNDDGQVSERIRDLEQQLTGRQQEREALGGDKEKAFAQVTFLKSGKQQALNGKQSVQKELDRALARIKTAETERDRAEKNSGKRQTPDCGRNRAFLRCASKRRTGSRTKVELTQR